MPHPPTTESDLRLSAQRFSMEYYSRDRPDSRLSVRIYSVSTGPSRPSIMSFRRLQFGSSCLAMWWTRGRENGPSRAHKMAELYRHGLIDIIGSGVRRDHSR